MRKLLKIIPPRLENQMDEILALVKEPVLILGHTHIPWQEQRNGQIALCPGAVNFPLNGWVGAQYAMLLWDGQQWTPEFRAIKYDLGAFERANWESGFLSTGILARLFLEEATSGQDISSDFFLLADQLAHNAGVSHLPYYPDEIWEQAEKLF